MSWNLGFLVKPAAAEPTSSVSPSTAGNELMPAGVLWLPSVLPVYASSAKASVEFAP
ncbi:MAG: hypothetical protein QOI10_3626 [Solirubrobacterales bacterium]|nr:hypothetical protein [Solirubrobacterales bacterium]